MSDGHGREVHVGDFGYPLDRAVVVPPAVPLTGAAGLDFVGATSHPAVARLPDRNTVHGLTVGGPVPLRPDGPVAAADRPPTGPVPVPRPVQADSEPGELVRLPVPVHDEEPDEQPAVLVLPDVPDEPALLCDREGRIARVNAALLGLASRLPAVPGEDLPGMGWRAAPDGLDRAPLPDLVSGPDTDARLVRTDGSLVPVRLVRRIIAGGELCLVLPHRAVPGHACGTPVGTWTFDPAAAALCRDADLEELYRAAGVPTGQGPTAVEAQQVAALSQALRTQARPAEHRMELAVAGNRALDYATHVEYGEDGTPVRLVGTVRLVAATPRSPRPPQSRSHRPPAPGRRFADQASRRFADLMAAVPGGVGLIDRTGRVIDANAGLCDLLDVRLEMLRGRTAASLTADGFTGQDPDPAESADGLPGWLRRASMAPDRLYRAPEVPLLRIDGTTVWCELAVTATPADDGSPLWLVVFTDVTERRRVRELLRSAGTVDELTRLPNRAATIELVDRLLAGPGRDRVAVVCGDLDDFSRVNSSLGHEAGDDLLVTLAGRLQRELPVSCTAARLSGDEFVVICADHSEVGGPDILARTVADLLRPTITVHGRPVQMTASVGVAQPVPAGEVRAADLLRFAEVAMQDVKRRQRRGGIGMATDGVVSSATMALELEAELRSTIATGGLTLLYQPVVGPDGTVLSAEALVRWPHPERGMISPAEFLPVAQRSGLLRDLDMWVLRTAAEEAATWPVARGIRPAVAVNLAGLLPGDTDFLDVVTGFVTDAGLPWDRLVLELVETSLVALPPHALAAMDTLVKRGVRFAVDDFGTGYSSLARLKELPAQTIKIDRAFVTGVGEDRADFAVARAVVDMAAAMNRTTVAEGVETGEQFLVLRRLGVDAFQGYFFAKPLTPHELRAKLDAVELVAPAAGL
ncbi:putative bifunctional diguanylate cyclase/phosphodiesterase [Pseudonocardia humida]|uniref:GGDEF domain-containing protein n=1 Tax=Pseudonocardia humida TaxID=2800819 RepID=A0ABT1AB26_9PSEU|nr:EAL domain-containing protein [Pseudonocardia humida]MCO1660141.1 GGDEF domain-containing protein [Pseudonocardia humida]